MHRSLGRAIKRAADRDHLLLAARQGAGELAEPLLDARKEGEDARQIVVEFGAARARIGAHLEVLVDRHARKQPPRLEHRGNAAPHPLGGADARAAICPRKGSRRGSAARSP